MTDPNDQLRLIPDVEPQVARSRPRARREAERDDDPFYFVPVDRYGRQLLPIRVDQADIPPEKQWHVAFLFSWLAVQHANERPPGWLAWQTWPC